MGISLKRLNFQRQIVSPRLQGIAKIVQYNRFLKDREVMGWGG